MKRKYLSALVLMLFVTVTISNGVFGQNDEMKKKAKKNMIEWSKSFSQEQFKHLGYKDKAEFDNAELGTPYVLYTVDPNKLVELDSTGDFGSLLAKTGYIVYPVISEGKDKSLLWMYQKDDEWKIARVGSAGLAENLKANEEVIKKYGEEMGTALESPRLVRIYQLYLDFFYVKGEKNDFVVPMQTIPDLRIKGNTFYSVKELLPVLQEDLKQKMPFKDEEGKVKEY